MNSYVSGEGAFVCKRFITAVAHKRILPRVDLHVLVKVLGVSERGIAAVKTAEKRLLRVHSDMAREIWLLPERPAAYMAREGSLPGVNTHMSF